jgi:hypothetical protein
MMEPVIMPDSSLERKAITRADFLGFTQSLEMVGSLSLIKPIVRCAVKMFLGMILAWGAHPANI